MTFQTVLTSDQYAKLRSGTYACAQHISVLRPVVELKARLSATPNGTSFANVSYGSVISGSYTTVMPGMTILISHEDNIRKAHFTGRVRDITSSTIGINETSAGLIANDYLWIIRDWRLQPKLAREVSGAQFKDYAQAYAGQNPIIYNLKAAYADWVDPTSGALRISFTPLDFAAQSGATISSRAWSTLPSGATLISGSLSDANITVDFDPGDYFLHYTVTDSGGRAQVRHIPIFAHDDTINPPALSFTSASIANSSAAWTANLRGFADIDDVLDGTLVVCWNEEYYNGEPGSIYDNIAGVFRLRRESLDGRADPTYSYDADASFELEDIATQLSRLTAPLIALRNVGSPTVWDEIANLTPYRAICHILETGSTFNSIHSLSFDAFDNIFECDSLNISGSLLGAIQDVARSINAVPEFAADGRCIVARDARYLDNTARQALPIIAAFTDGSGGTTSDLIDVSYQHGHTRDAGRVDASGGTYQTSSGRVDPFLAIAPGSASEGGEGRPSLTGQILAANSAAGVAKAELISRAANLLEIANGPDRLIVTHPDGYHWLTPSISQWYTFSLGDTLALRGMSFNGATRWLLESVSLEPDNAAGTVAVRATYVCETYGYGGIAFEPPTAGEIAPYLPDLPAFGPYDFAFPELPALFLGENPSGVNVPPGLSSPPASGNTTVPRDGNTLLIWDGAHVWVTRQLLKSANPPWTDVTPDPSHTVQYADFDPFTDSKGRVGAYTLTTSGGTSYVWHCADVFAAAPDWEQGAGIAGTFTMLRTTSTKGGVLVYAPNVGSSTPTTVTATFDAGGTTYTLQHGTLQASGGNPNGNIYDGISSDVRAMVRIDLPSPQTVTNVKVDYWKDHTGNVGRAVLLFDSSNNLLGIPFDTVDVPANATWNTQDSGAISVANVSYAIFDVHASLASDLQVRMDNCVITYQPHVADTVVRYSNTYGASWGSEIGVGTSPGSAGGFDRIVIGNVSLVAADAKVEKATTLGGAYSDEANGSAPGTYPLAILIPAGQKGSASNNNINTTTPQYIFATPATFSGKSVVWVTTTQVDITPTVSSNPGLAVSPDCLAAWRGSALFAVLSFGGTRRLMYYNGTSWTDRGAVGANAVMVKVRRRAAGPGQVFVADGAVVKYSGNKGATLVSKTTPATTLRGVECWG